ncbi:MATE family efflux transporter [Candidatus Woesearchaeota archaeon]|nr:MATE family efflux transporter [Candidatus Woesearchaeota archaeon]
MEKVNEFAKNPRKALFRLAWPIMLATIVQTLYNVVDTAYVGRLGEEALAAITFSFPLFFILIALNAGINTGMSSRIARFLGENKKKEAENTAMHGLIISSAVAILIAIIAISFLRQILAFLGARGNVLEFAVDYMNIIFAGSVFMFLAYVFNGIFSAQGNTKTPMKIMIASTLINVALDPFFIFPRVLGIPGLGLGIQGAALATVISFFTGLAIFMAATRKVSYLHVHRRNFHFSLPIIREIFSVGLPSSFTMLLLSIYIMFLNRVLVTFGTSHVAMFGIVSRLESVAMMPVVGLAIATLTLVGMFYGAGKYNLVSEVSWFAIRSSLYITASVGIVFFLAPKFFFDIFTSEASILAIGSPYLRLDVLTFPLMALTMLAARIMQAMGKGLPGMILQIIRVFVVAVPLAYVFVFIFEFSYISVAVAMISGGAASTATGIAWLVIKLKKIEKKPIS